MSSRINILHLSDFHYDKPKSEDIKIVVGALIKDLKRFQDEGIEVDFVVFSGDLVQRGDDGFPADLKSIFISPLLTELRITKDCFFIAPGNHDIQKSRVDEIDEEGLKHYLNQRDKVNSFLDNVDQKANYLERLSKFNEFKESIESVHLVRSNILFSTYLFKIRDKEIGVACLNSAWRATGRDDNADYGLLLIGERQIDQAYEEIMGADLKIAISHHPFEWLIEFERISLKRLMLSYFDIIFLGHNHDSSPEFLEIPINRAVVSHGGCLYSNRDFFNGYSLISYDPVGSKVDMYVQQYFDGRREFDKGLSHVPEGIKTYHLLEEKRIVATALTPAILEKLTSIFEKHSNEFLLSATDDTNAPKQIGEIFVALPISKYPEFKAHAKSDKNRKGSYVSMEQIV
ncbi:metallophosphoesterase, partial [bacterium]|nr:metallophosphoesterase [bacterium]